MVKKADHREHNGDSHKGQHQVAPSAQCRLDRPPSDPPRQVADGKQVEGEVNRYWVHADPDKRHAPLAPLPDFDGLVEGAQQEAGIAAGDQHVRGRPNLLDHRELETPKEAGSEPCEAGRQQPEDLLLIRESPVLEPKASEYAQQAGGHGWHRAEDALGVVGAVPFAPRQVEEVNLLGQV